MYNRKDEKEFADGDVAHCNRFRFYGKGINEFLVSKVVLPTLDVNDSSEALTTITYIPFDILSRGMDNYNDDVGLD